MKKTMVLVGMGFFLFLGTGCGAKEQTSTWALKEEDENVTVQNTYKEDDLLKQKVTTVIQYKTMGITTKAKAEEVLKPSGELYKNKKGIKQTIDYKDKEAVETIEIDLKKVDDKEIKNIMFVSLPKTPINQASEKANEEQLTKLGFKKEK